MEPVLNEEPVLNDSLDDFIALSQAANLDIGQNLEDSDLEEDGGDLGQDNQDSFDELMSQVDDNDYLRMGQPSAKLKVIIGVSNQKVVYQNWVRRRIFLMRASSLSESFDLM